MEPEKNKGGRPAGSKEAKPRKGSKAEIVCKCFDNPAITSTREIITHAMRYNKIELSSKYVAQALNRWRPDWKAKYHAVQGGAN